MKRKLLVVAIGMFMFLGGLAPQAAQAASSWSFASAQEKNIAVGDTVQMSYRMYRNFDLFKNNQLITEVNDANDDYSVVWTSSNPDIVWINAKTGQAKANKFDRMETESGEVTISAHITNTVSKKQIVRSFFVVVDNSEYVEKLNAETEKEAVTEEVVPTPSVTPAPETPEVPESTEEPAADTPHLLCTDIKKITLKEDWETNIESLFDSLDFAYGGIALKTEHEIVVASAEYMPMTLPGTHIYLQKVTLLIPIKKAINPDWEDESQYILEEAEVNHLFEIK